MMRVVAPQDRVDQLQENKNEEQQHHPRGQQYEGGRHRVLHRVNARVDLKMHRRGADTRRRAGMTGIAPAGRRQPFGAHRRRWLLLPQHRVEVAPFVRVAVNARRGVGVAQQSRLAVETVQVAGDRVVLAVLLQKRRVAVAHRAGLHELPHRPGLEKTRRHVLREVDRIDRQLFRVTHLAALDLPVRKTPRHHLGQAEQRLVVAIQTFRLACSEQRFLKRDVAQIGCGVGAAFERLRHALVAEFDLEADRLRQVAGARAVHRRLHLVGNDVNFLLLVAVGAA